ncbi:MAG: hypothetical protein NTU41_12575 [Chloroflexi bacterium]|nr:hypothetical protein [Chloroflexota bacterium]
MTELLFLDARSKVIQVELAGLQGVIELRQSKLEIVQFCINDVQTLS